VRHASADRLDSGRTERQVDDSWTASTCYLHGFPVSRSSTLVVSADPIGDDTVFAKGSR